MSKATRHAEDVIPAQLSFLAIYNPSLGNSDETLENQIVYYWSKTSRASRRGKTNEQQQEDRNERLRQIGLAQGMVEFAKAFSNGEAVDSIDTEKSKIVLHELEPGWWILASIDLTRLLSTPDAPLSFKLQEDGAKFVEYSAREVCPHTLLLQHLLRAHSIFLLHHAPSLAELYIKLTRPQLCGVLERFWNKFSGGWDVLLHGNPAVDIFNGLKLAAGGELGVGVGEEAWGSGEREVLEGFIGRTDGLVDLVVSRFGEAPATQEDPAFTIIENPPRSNENVRKQWLGSGRAPKSSDGVVFSGTGAVSRHSLRSLTGWIEWIYRDGESAYGVRDSPSSDHRRKRRKVNPSGPNDESSNFTQDHRDCKVANGSRYTAPAPGSASNIPPPVVSVVNSTPRDIRNPRENSQEVGRLRRASGSASPTTDGDAASGTETLIKYLTLGVYGSAWGVGVKKRAMHRKVSQLPEISGSIDQPLRDTGELRIQDKLSEAVDTLNGTIKEARVQISTLGSFMIGLQGDLEHESLTEDEYNNEDDNMETGIDRANTNDQANWNRRILLRTLYLERTKSELADSSADIDRSLKILPKPYHNRFQVVVYVHQPFIFTFLFELHTDSLAMPSFYKSLHHQLGPLQRALLLSTSPSKVFDRLREASSITSTTSADRSQPIYDLVYDPASLTVHTTVPAIPEPGTTIVEGLGSSESPWTRIEALNVHLQIINTYMATRARPLELERTCKTSRGWWIVWMRLPPSIILEQMSSSSCREAILIRRASDYVTPSARKVSGRFSRELLGSGAASGWVPSKLAEGVGIDARRYIEGLLSLNR